MTARLTMMTLTGGDIDGEFNGEVAETLEIMVKIVGALLILREVGECPSCCG